MTVKLYDVPRTERGTWVRVLEDTNGPPSSKPFNEGDLVCFFHIDGMYSYCNDREGNVVHLYAGQEVEIVEPNDVGV